MKGPSEGPAFNVINSLSRSEAGVRVVAKECLLSGSLGAFTVCL